MIKKICLLTDSLSSGGAEKMVSNLSFSLSKKGYQVYIVTMIDEITYPFAGELFNFGKIKLSNTKIKSFLKFNSYIKEHQFDVILDHRVRTVFFKELLFSKIVFKNCYVIYCVHHYDLSFYFPCLNMAWFSRLTLVKYRKIVTVSKEIKQVLKRQLKLNSNVIYNYPLFNNLENINVSEIPTDTKYIIGIGRLTIIKQFDVLIKSYKKSKLSETGIQLLILGEGPEKNNLEQLIRELNLNEFVKLKGFQNNPHTFIKHSNALVLSSKSEGFPMVLIEALELGIPIISFNCKSGPSEIIKHEINGLLVQNQNTLLLTDALNKLMFDTSLYDKIKYNITHNLNIFSEDIIIKKWINLIENFD